MKLVTFETTGPAGRLSRVGALIDGDENGRVVDLTAAFGAYLAMQTDEPTPAEYARLRTPPDMIGLLTAGHEGMAAAEAALAFASSTPDLVGLNEEQAIYQRSEVRLLPPVPRPGAFRAFSIYADHMTRPELTPMVEGSKPWVKTKEWYMAPPYYKGSTTAIFGPEDPVPWPYYSDRLDLELELGIVVGKQGTNLTVEEAASHIAGYCIVVDSSCRDGYAREPFGPNKRKDFHTAIGPCLTTPDEVDPENLACSISVDGELWFEGNTNAPHSFSPAQLVAYASDNEWVMPGDLLGTGTIGFGCSMDIHKWIQKGQTATFTIEGLGAMSLVVKEGPRVVEHVHGMEGQLAFTDAEAS